MSFLYRDALSPALGALMNYNKLFRRFDGSSQSDFKTGSGLFHDGWWITYGEGDKEVWAGAMVFYVSGRVIESTLLAKFVKSLGVDWDEFRTQEVDSQVDYMYYQLKPGFKWDGTTRWDGEYSDSDTPTPPKFQATEGLADPSNTDISNSLNKAFEVGDTVTIGVSYGGDMKRYISDHELPWVATGTRIETGGFNPKVIRDTLMSNPWYYLANSRHVSWNKDSNQFQLYNAGNYAMPKDDIVRPSKRNLPTADVYLIVDGKKKPLDSDEEVNTDLGLFALMDTDNSVWEPLKDSDGEIRVYNPTVTTKSTNGYTATNADILCSDDEFQQNILRCDGEALNYRFEYKFVFKGAKPSSHLIGDMLTWYPNFYQDPKDIPIEFKDTPDKYQDKLATSTLDTKFKKALETEMSVIEPLGLLKDSDELSLTVNGSYSVAAIRSMKRVDFSRLIATKLDIGHKVKENKGSWIATIVVVFVAIVITYVTWGAGSGLVGTATQVATNVAVSAGAGATALAVGQIALQFAGIQLSGSQMRLIGNIATVAGIVATVTGIYAAVQNAAKSAIKEGATGIFKKSLVSQAYDFVSSKITSMFDSVLSVVKTAIQGVEMATEHMMAEEKEESDMLEAQAGSIEQQQKDIDFQNKAKIDALFATEEDKQDYKTDQITKLGVDMHNDSGQGILDMINASKDICTYIEPQHS